MNSLANVLLFEHWTPYALACVNRKRLGTLGGFLRFDRLDCPKLPSSPRNATPVHRAIVRRLEPWRVFVANEFTVDRADRMRGAK